MLVVFAVYINTLFNGFVLDDETQVLRNPWIKDWRFIPDMFSRNVWSFLRDTTVSNYYRPLMHVIYLVSYKVFGLRAWGFHLVNVVFHAANTVLVFLLTSRLTGVDAESDAPGGDRFSALLFSLPFGAALLFATHPAHGEAVAWIASIPELSFSFLYLLSFYLYVGLPPRPGGQLAASVTLYFLALLCKETALTLPVLFAVYDLAFRRGERWGADRLTRYVPYLLAAAVYLALRYSVLSQTFVPAARWRSLSVYESIINVFPLFSLYVQTLLLPTRLHFWHSFRPIVSLASVEGMLSLAVVGAFVGAALYAWKTHRVSFLCLALFAIPLAPAFYINALPGKPFAERYLYLPSVGFVILVALGLRRLAAVRGMRMAALIVLVSTTALYSAGSISRNRVWKDFYTLFADTMRKSPDAPVPCDDLALALFDKGRVDEAIEQFDRQVSIDANNSACQSALGSALLLKGRLDEAIEHLTIALSLAPGSLASYNDLGIALRRKGNVLGAIEQYQKALEIDPGYADAHFNLGSALADTGQTRESLEHYRAAVRLRPDNAYYRNVLGIECGKLGLLDEAIEQFQECIRLAPEEPAYRRNLERARNLKTADDQPGEPPVPSSGSSESAEALR